MGDSDSPPSSATTATEAGVSMHKTMDGKPFERTTTHGRELWKFRMRPDDDAEPQDWWFASTAIPLLAAAVGPLANVLSIAALVTSWRNDIPDNGAGTDEASVGFPDPRWCIALNAASLACGFAGNMFLMFNFTRRIRYILALPMTIVLWYFATGILIAIMVAMNEYIPPIRPQQTYSQGFWHAVIAAALYLFSAMILMVNMLGYFLGHYPQHFELSEEQRNLILQTMMFFIWLAGGGGVFAKVCDWKYVDALYFCDVTILTVGFGDFAAPNDVGRGLVFPYSVGGIIILGLVVSSIRQFALELGHDKVIKNHVERRRVRTIGRSLTGFTELHRQEVRNKGLFQHGQRPVISAPVELQHRSVTFNGDDSQRDCPRSKQRDATKHGPLQTGFNVFRRVGSTMPKMVILREEKDRFTAMRDIQRSTAKFKRWYALTLSVIAFGLVWCVGAVVFWRAEQREQGLSYFQALYFCYVSLLTIGYGDLSPKSNAGKPFFIVWSLIAVPTMTILVSDMGETVVANFKRGTFTLADWTVLPKAGLWRSFLERHPWLLIWLQNKAAKRAEEKRIAQGFQTGIDEENVPAPTLKELAKGPEHVDEHDLARKLALAIRTTAHDLKANRPRRYTYEEWVEYTRLIRFSSQSKEELDLEEEEEGLVEWDWIGEDSPMLAEHSESEWLLDRLCESLDRYMKKQVPEYVKHRRKSQVLERISFSRRESRVDCPAGAVRRKSHVDGEKSRTNGT
ncbi:MAG: Potassium channel [Pleopsidium flavum]|nr:MAG: Potassium channel [Pleopsidium flavum]